MLAFSHIEKTAGTSVHATLRNWFATGYMIIEGKQPGQNYFSAANLQDLFAHNPGLQAFGGHSIKPFGDLNEAIPDLKWWTLLRDPIERCASHYQFQVQRMGVTKSFEEWIEIPHYQNYQTRKITNCENLGLAIHSLEEQFLCVGLTEQYKASLLMLCEYANLPVPLQSSTRRNVAADNTIKHNLLKDPASLLLLQQTNRVDQQLYDHVQTVLFPKYRKQCGPKFEKQLARLRSVTIPEQRSALVA